MKRLVGLAALLAVLAPLPLTGQAGAPGAAPEHPAGLPEWQPLPLLPGVFYMPLVGESTKPGPYVYRIRAPHGFLVAPHWHTQTMHLTVLSGTLVLAMGEPPDSTRAQHYTTGSFLVMPAGMRHLEWFEGETVVHIETQGPVQTLFVDPADDPRNRGEVGITR